MLESARMFHIGIRGGLYGGGYGHLFREEGYRLILERHRLFESIFYQALLLPFTTTTKQHSRISYLLSPPHGHVINTESDSNFHFHLDLNSTTLRTDRLLNTGMTRGDQSQC